MDQREAKEVAKTTLHGLVQRGARKQQRELYPLRATDPRKLQPDQSVYEQLEEEGWGAAPATVPVGFAASKEEEGYGGDGGDGAEGGVKRRPRNGAGAAGDEDDDGDDDDDEDDNKGTISMLSRSESNGGLGRLSKKLTTWELDHFRRRHFLLPQGAWPILPSIAPAAPARPAPTQGEDIPRPPPPEALPDDLAIDGVRHYVPRVRSSGGARKLKKRKGGVYEPAETRLEWLPFENVVSEPLRKKKKGDENGRMHLNYPVPSPVLARVLDAAIVRQLAGVVHAPRPEDDDDDEDEEEEGEEREGEGEEEEEEEGGEGEKKPVEVRLYDLLQAALGRLGHEEEEEDKDEDEEEDALETQGATQQQQQQQQRQRRHQKQSQRERAQATHLLHQCLGREVERLTDALLGHFLSYWAERSQAHRSDETYLAWLRRHRAAHAADPRKNRALEDVKGVASQSLALGDWHDVLGAMEEKAAVDEAGRKGGREARREVEKEVRKQAKKQLKGKVRYKAVKRRILTEHDRKMRERLDKAEEEAGEEEDEEGREGEVNVMRPALEPGTLRRTRARLERMFWAGKGALPPEERL